MEIPITYKNFKPHKGNYGLQGYFEMKVGDWLFLDGILVYFNKNELYFKTPAKRLKNDSYCPFYEITSPEVKQQIIKAIKDSMDEIGLNSFEKNEEKNEKES